MTPRIMLRLAMLFVPADVFRLPSEKRVLGDAVGQGFVVRDQAWLDLSVIEQAIKELAFRGRERDQRVQSLSTLRDQFAGPRLGMAQLARDLSAQRWDQLVFELVRFVTGVADGNSAPVLRLIAP